MISTAENERLTGVGPETPTGAMLRRYWWPVAFADEVKGIRPKAVKLLGEEFVVFRDGEGRLGMLESQCAHRRTSLKYGRVEKHGIRCCYHGWVFDTRGKCLETPCEEPESTMKDRISMAAFPVQEAGGLVFAYIGPQPAPLLPRYDLFVHAAGTRYVWGFTDHCNWLQSAENAADGTHLHWLHAGPYPFYAAKRPEIDIHRRDYGFDYVSRVEGIPAEKYTSLIFPACNRFASGRAEQALGARQNMLFRSPADDTHSLNFFITIYPSLEKKLMPKTETPPEMAHRGPWIPTEPGVYGPGDEAWWGVESIMQDRMALEGQGTVYDRSRENLASSDKGVAAFRQMLRESIDAVAVGRDPVGIIRDAAKNTVIEFGTHFHTIEPTLRVQTQTESA